jgi:hypothetical protein
VIVVCLYYWCLFCLIATIFSATTNFMQRAKLYQSPTDGDGVSFCNIGWLEISDMVVNPHRFYWIYFAKQTSGHASSLLFIFLLITIIRPSYLLCHSDFITYYHYILLWQTNFEYHEWITWWPVLSSNANSKMLSVPCFFRQLPPVCIHR